MKKSFIIYSLFLSASFFISYSSQAQQQQQKPSERSFTAEIEKVKQMQAARNVKISQLPQPVANTTVLGNNDKQTVIDQNQTTNRNTSTQKIQPIPAAKPSTGPM